MTDVDPNDPKCCREWLFDYEKNPEGPDLDDAVALALAHARRMTTPCKWTQDEDDVYHSDCGHSFEFTWDGPKENQAVWCCYCGHPIEEVPYKSEEEKENKPS